MSPIVSLSRLSSRIIKDLLRFLRRLNCGDFIEEGYYDYIFYLLPNFYMFM